VSSVPILEVAVESRDGRWMIRARGEIDLSSVDALRGPLAEARKARAATVVDLTGIEFMDSSGLHLLLDSALDAERDDWSLSFRPSRQVLRLLEVTGTLGIVPLSDGRPG
jgi:anti-sigma B factor antagonist